MDTCVDSSLLQFNSTRLFSISFLIFRSLANFNFQLIFFHETQHIFQKGFFVPLFDNL